MKDPRPENPAPGELEQVARGVVHDTAHWLEVILGHVDLLEAESGPSPRLRQLREAALACAGVQDRLRRYWATGQPWAGPRRLALEGLVRDVARQIAASTGRSPTLGPLPQEAWVRGDPAALSDALLNLLGNAFDAVGPEGRVTVELRPGPSSWRVSVSDDGPGMEPAVLARCRESGFSTKGDQGSGLGLALVLEIVERHGGVLDVASRPGQGTEVTMVLPVAKPASSTGARPRRLLLIEDEATLAQLLVEACALEGIEVEVAGDGETAIELYSAARHDVVVADFGLPGIDGLTAAERIRQRDPAAAIVLLTGAVEDGETLGRAAAMDQVAHKPVDLATFVDLSKRAYAAGLQRREKDPQPSQRESR